MLFTSIKFWLAYAIQLKQVPYRPEAGEYPFSPFADRGNKGLDRDKWSADPVDKSRSKWLLPNLILIP
jgi:hypothetical protein